MNKDLVYSLTDDKFKELAENSVNRAELARRLGFKYTPGLNSKNRIKKRCNDLHIVFKEKKIINPKRYIIPDGTGRSKIKGDISELSVQIEFLKAGIKVSTPVGDNCPYDLIIDYNDKLYKVQVKTATLQENGSFVAKLSSTYICEDKIYKNRKYPKEKVDIFAINSIEESKTCYIINDGKKRFFYI